MLVERNTFTHILHLYTTWFSNRQLQREGNICDLRVGFDLDLKLSADVLTVIVLRGGSDPKVMLLEQIVTQPHISGMFPAANYCAGFYCFRCVINNLLIQ